MNHAAKPFRVLTIAAITLLALLALLLLQHTAVSAGAIVPEAVIQAANDGWVINEIHADPAADAPGDANGDGTRDAGDDEFVEIVNNTGAAVDISGWTLSDEVSVRHTFPEGTLVPHQCAVVVFGGGTPGGAFGNATVQTADSGSLGLNNGGDTLTLSDGTAAQAGYTYGSEGGNDQSLTRDPDVTGPEPLVQHTAATGAGGALFSPGTRVDGSFFAGCEQAADAAPTVTETTPPDGATAVARDTDVTVTFSEAVTATVDSFTIDCTTSGAVAFALSGGDVTYTLAPDSALAFGETCTVTVLADQVQDKDGNDPPDTMEADYQWSFTVEETADDAPTVLATTPVSGATGVALTTTLSLTFSEPVTLSGPLDLACAASGAITTSISGGPQVFTLTPARPLAHGETCTATVPAAQVSDQDGEDPPDALATDYTWDFTTAVADFLLINEVDSDTPGTDEAEFIELYDGGAGNTHLGELVVVLYNGANDASYAAFDLDTYFTDAAGYFVLGNELVSGVDLSFANGTLQNGADAVALHVGSAADFPNGTAVTDTVTTDTVTATIDALVYDTADADDPELLQLLNPGEPQVDEDGRGDKDAHSNQRCPNGAGGGRNTNGYKQNPPTPKAENNCLTDEAPAVVATTPVSGATDVPLTTTLSVTFSEPVTADAAGFDLACTTSGSHSLALSSNDDISFTLTPDGNLAYSESCTVTIAATAVADQDTDDPPDAMATAHQWSFTFEDEPDEAPRVTEIVPADGATNVPPDAPIVVTFSEPVAAADDAFALSCSGSGAHALRVQTDGVRYLLRPQTGFVDGDACKLTVLADRVSDVDADDPPDGMTADFQAAFTTQPADVLLINEVDADTPGTDAAEFIELYDGGSGNVHLGGHVVVLYNGAGDTVYGAFALDGYFSDADGYFVLGNTAVSGADLILPDSTLQNGADAVALYLGTAADFPNGTAVTTDNLRDALVYDTADADDPELLTLLNPGQPQVDEDGRGDKDAHSNQRCPNGEGGGRNTGGYLQNPPTPALANNCVIDDAPTVVSTDPADGATAVSVASDVTVTFSEPVLVDETSFVIECAAGGSHSFTLSGGDAAYTLNPNADFAYEESCTVSVLAAGVRDADGDDPPDTMAADYTWQFTTEREPDAAPQVRSTDPADGATAVPLDATITITFSEAVNTAAGWFEITCGLSGPYAATPRGGPQTFVLTPAVPFAAGETCTVTVRATAVTDQDTNDPPDAMAADYTWQFETVVDPPTDVLINELDADTPGSDEAEFIELYDGGAGNTSLTGLVVVLYNGASDTSYAALDLDGHQTGSDGYFVIGNAAVANVELFIANGTLQNGADAIALYAGNADDFPNGTAVTTDNLLDAIVYGTGDADDPELLALLNPGQPQVDEDGRGQKDTDSSQRCPNGSGGQRNSDSYRQNAPTPGVANNCTVDSAPRVTATTPGDGATNVAPGANLTISFSEPVTIAGDGVQVTCAASGDHDGALSGGPQIFTFNPAENFGSGESCTATVVATAVSDADDNDPPDGMAADYTWTFATADQQPATTDVLINELDVDTPGNDAAEFIELRSEANAPLDGLVLVFFNGSGDTAYRAIDLDGQRTDGSGYFVVGNTAVPGVDLVMPDGSLQNGPDAVALYAGSAGDFPNGTAVTTSNLLDAVVYGTGDADDPELLTLLNPGQPQVDEDGAGDKDAHSSQRCPDGSGGQRNTETFAPHAPTPGAANRCVRDEAPRITGVSPGDGATDVALNRNVQVTFSEDVTVSGAWFVIDCNASGSHDTSNTAVSGGPRAFTLDPDAQFARGEACTVTVFAAQVSDADGNDPPDTLAADVSWQFRTVAPPVAENVLINEVDADTPGSDEAEFIELYDGGAGNTDLSGLVIVLFNGSSDASYRTFELAGARTDAGGYFVLGNAAVPNVDRVIPNSSLQNGADAVALYAGSAADFPSGTAVTTRNLLDAIAYDTADADDPELLALLNDGQPQADEDGAGDKDAHSNQRCPNGSGGPRNTAGYAPHPPTPGRANDCTNDAAPQVARVVPADGAGAVALAAALTVTFDEPVAVSGDWFAIDCGSATFTPANTAVSGGPTTFTLTPQGGLPRAAACTATVFAGGVNDLDATDPPDELPADFRWQFTTAAGAVAENVLINEVDADTPGSDEAEFIELYDGGAGNTDLSGLVIVLFNGSNDASYRAIDLNGARTDAQGYFVLGNAAVPGVDLVMPDSSVQNGPDAVALYRGSAAGFPNGTPPSDAGLFDALVYDTADDDDPELLALLNPGQPQVDEDGRGDKDAHSNQRCPNGAGGGRNSDGYRQNPPTPGSANDCTADTPPVVTAVSPGDGATGVAADANLRVTFSEAVDVGDGWFALACSSSGALAADVSGGPTDFTLDPQSDFAPGETCTATLFAARIVDRDGTADAMTADFSWSFSVGVPAFGACGDPATPIHLIQGDGEASPLLDTAGVIIEGIVVGDFQGSDGLSGFFVQEEDTDADAEPETSEGIFVFDGDGAVDVAAGDVVRVQGDVAEYFGLTELTRVREVAVCAGGAAVTPATITLPIADLAAWEHAEGMLVTLPHTLTVTGNYDLGRFGAVDLSVNGRLYQPTNVVAPGTAAGVLQDINARSRILLDDGRTQQNPLPLPPYFGPENTLRAGDTLTGLSGVLSYGFDAYRIQPVAPVAFTRANPRPDPPQGDGRLRVASFNVLNYFNGDGAGGGFPTPRGAETAQEFARQRAKIISAILALDADVIGLMEIENDGYGPQSAIQDLVDGLNAAAPPGVSYAFVDPGRPQLGGDEIAVGLLYRLETVAPVSAVVTLDDPPFDSLNRQPLAQTFRETAGGETFTVVVNHFKSKGSCPDAGENADQGDGQGCWNALRVTAAAALADWLADDPTGSGDADVLLIGDFNAYAQEDPLAMLANGGYTDLLADDGAPGYSYVFDGQAGSLDHALGSPSMAAQVSSAAVWHVNADEPRALDYNDYNQPELYRPNPFRASDHDPLVVGLTLAPVEASFSSNTPVMVGHPARFTNESSGPGPLSYTWDFGDGSPPVTEANPTHVYTAVGSYTVTLTVEAPGGETAVFTATHVVTPATLLLPLIGR